MVDWASADYAQEFPGTFITPEPGGDEGIYLTPTGRPYDAFGGLRGRAPAEAAGRGYDFARDVSCSARQRDGGERRGSDDRSPDGHRTERRERFGGPPLLLRRTSASPKIPKSPGAPEWPPRAVPPGGVYQKGGQFTSSRRDNHAIFDVAWDERPQRYRPESGPPWARLVPPTMAPGPFFEEGSGGREAFGRAARWPRDPDVFENFAGAPPQNLLQTAPSSAGGPPQKNALTGRMAMVLLLLVAVLLGANLCAMFALAGVSSRLAGASAQLAAAAAALKG